MKHKKEAYSMNVFKLTWRIFLVAALALAVVSSPGLRAQQRREIIVSAAASLRDAFTEIGAIYEKRTGVRPSFNFGASGALQQQIEAGAPADVFASAGQQQMDELQAKGLIINGTRRNFTANTLVLIVSAKSRLGIKSIEDIANPKIGRIAIVNPKTSPAGQYTQESLTALKLWDKVQSRMIPGETVRQVLDYVSRDEVDAGFVYTSDAASARNKIRVVAEAPKDTHEQITYPIAVLRDSTNADAARKFIDLTLSGTGKDILGKYSFIEVE
jgi:molybdate transport system substrate-binding protein